MSSVNLWQVYFDQVVSISIRISQPVNHSMTITMTSITCTSHIRTIRDRLLHSHQCQPAHQMNDQGVRLPFVSVQRHSRSRQCGCWGTGHHRGQIARESWAENDACRSPQTQTTRNPPNGCAFRCSPRSCALMPTTAGVRACARPPSLPCRATFGWVF